ncbi:MAG: hypothetical protein EP298_08155 [Gammaproteobacteria bacterium]|nr:MAG: hypothetical protein EP298_08155 [Gammaproteobacteria bacterium]UTW42900.1 phosphatase PAP2 family protein [bacterium SCSIO 12844]
MQNFLDFVKKHAVILAGLFAFLLMAMIQWKVQYPLFGWGFVIVFIWSSFSLYIIAQIIKYFKPIRQKELSTLTVNILTFISISLIVYLFCRYSSADLPLVPYPLIDAYLVKFDAFFHFNVADITEYFRVNLPLVSEAFQYIYASLKISTIITLILIPIINWKSYQRLTFMFLFLMALTYIFCYFFPSIGPAYSYPDAYFTKNVIAVKNDYLQLRSNPTSHAVSACVSIPSWHVIGSLLILMAWWPVKKFGFRYFVAIYSSLLIISIFITGWHYLADAIASFIFMGIGLYTAKKLDMTVPTYDFSMLMPLWNIIKGYRINKKIKKISYVAE